MWFTALKNLSKCFRMSLQNYEATLLDGLSEDYGYRSQEIHEEIHTVLQHIIVCL